MRSSGSQVQQRKLAIRYNPAYTAWHTVHMLLEQAKKTGKDGPVAQYLVGAKLQLRFPDTNVGNESYSTDDDQPDRPGDYCLGDTAFHITVNPFSRVYDRCKRNLAEGYRVYLLVPHAWVATARLAAEEVAQGRIAVESIEGFVGHNLDELATFTGSGLRSDLRRLLVLYNERVADADLDQSMQIDIPRNLPKT